MAKDGIKNTLDLTTNKWDYDPGDEPVGQKFFVWPNICAVYAPNILVAWDLIEKAKIDLGEKKYQYRACSVGTRLVRIIGDSYV